MPLVGALLYGASPIDLIPDIVPLLGIVDDAVIVPTLLLLSAALWLRSRRARRQRVTVDVPARTLPE